MRWIDGDKRVEISLKLNGRKVRGRAESRTLLCDFLRHELGATGTHSDCEHGVCGACTVRIDGILARSCLVLAVQTQGREVESVEGLGSPDALGALQAARVQNLHAKNSPEAGFPSCSRGKAVLFIIDLDRFLSKIFDLN